MIFEEVHDASGVWVSAIFRQRGARWSTVLVDDRDSARRLRRGQARCHAMRHVEAAQRLRNL